MKRGAVLVAAGALAIGGCASPNGGPAVQTGEVSFDTGPVTVKGGRVPTNGGGSRKSTPVRPTTPLRVSRSLVRHARHVRVHLTPRQLGRRIAARHGWRASQWSCLETMWDHESGWNPRAANPYSTAYGIAQFLDSTWGGVGGHRTSSPRLQIRYGLRYVERRYGSPCGAWTFWRAHRWY